MMKFVRVGNTPIRHLEGSPEVQVTNHVSDYDQDFVQLHCPDNHPLADLSRLWDEFDLGVMIWHRIGIALQDALAALVLDAVEVNVYRTLRRGGRDHDAVGLARTIAAGLRDDGVVS